jgi:predicted small secreted protein
VFDKICPRRFVCLPVDVKFGLSSIAKENGGSPVWCLENRAGQTRQEQEAMATLLKRFLAVTLMIGFGMALTACETAHGFGKDLEKLGQQIQEDAK